MLSPTGHPCRECPWRRASAPGWLGPWEPTEWIMLAHGDQAVACHLTLDGETDAAEGTRACSGAGIFRSHVCKVPRGEAAGHLVPANRELVFASRGEFLEHHELGEV